MQKNDAFRTEKNAVPNPVKNTQYLKISSCVSLCGVSLRSVYHIANQNLRLSLVAFKGTNWRNPCRGEHIYHERKDLKYKMLIY